MTNITMDTLLDEEDTLTVASQTWNRITNAALKEGYSSGILAKSELDFQEGFDAGYKEAFNYGILLGKYQGLVSRLPSTIKHPENINKLLNDNMNEKCYICCSKEQGNCSDVCDCSRSRTMKEVQFQQQQYMENMFKTLYDYFIPIFKRYNIDVSQLNVIM